MRAHKKEYVHSLLIILFTVSISFAQYFGQNKVKYENFHFKILKTDHFDIYYYPEEKILMQKAALMAERWYARHSKILDHRLSGRQALIIYSCPPQFDQTNIIEGQVGEGTGGVTEALKRRIIMPFAGPLKETNHVIGHELVHAFQYDITGQGKGAMRRLPAALELPLWFIEGMAEYFSLGPEDPNTTMWMRDAVKHKIPTAKQMENPEFFPYRFGQAFLAYIGGKWSDEKIGDILRDAGKQKNIYTALKDVLGISADSLSKDWQRTLHETYDPVMKQCDEPSKYGAVLIKANKKNGKMNVSPVLSPDGNSVLFFSEKDIFTINLYLADAHSGKIIRKIMDAARDPHLESLEFISSAGSWKMDSKHFVFAVVDQGRPALIVINVPKNKIERKIRFPHLGQILNPSWSPDGRFIVFSAINHGQSDLFLYNLQNDSLSQLTDDAYADLQPSWSPDGKHIAFVTDRFSTDLNQLRFGNYRLADFEIDSGDIIPLPSFTTGKNINPQWSPDMQSLYFVSDQSGISNIYRINLNNGKMYQLTNIFTGVSGITALSPTISSAMSVNRLVYSVFDDRSYSIYSIDSRVNLAGWQPDKYFSSIQLTMLPPVNRPFEGVRALKSTPEFGLPLDLNFKTVAYKPKLMLDYIGQPYLAVGASRFGTYLSGGVSLFWSDMLNNHNLATAIQANGRFTDIGGMVSYLDRAKRWNWGVAVQHIPYTTGAYNSGYAQIDSQAVYVEDEMRISQYFNSISGIWEYPFNRAQRLEINGTFNHITFKEEENLWVSSMVTGGEIYNRTEHYPAPAPLNFASASIALVYDQTFFGATSPLLGQRYRIEFSPSLGSMTYYTVLTDYRRYFMPIKPFTLALRFMHYGRYGKNADDPRLAPLYIGYQSFVRGYDYNSFTAGEVAQDTSKGLSQLYGSRMIVGNIEIRFPFFNVLGIGKGFYGIFPLESAIFFDSGLSWNNKDKPWFWGGKRKLVRSAGIAMRVNFGGYFLAEADYVKPFDRPNDKWRLQFGFITGF